MKALIQCIRSLIDNSVPEGDGLEKVCTADIESLERCAFFIDPTFKMSADAADYLKDYPLPWNVREVYEEQAHIEGPFYIEDADGGVVAEAISTRQHALSAVNAWSN